MSTCETVYRKAETRNFAGKAGTLGLMFLRRSELAFFRPILLRRGQINRAAGVKLSVPFPAFLRQRLNDLRKTIDELAIQKVAIDASSTKTKIGDVTKSLSDKGLVANGLVAIFQSPSAAPRLLRVSTTFKPAFRPHRPRFRER
jgi:hypothetical protein